MIFNLTNVSERFARWWFWLLEFDFDVEHGVGVRRQAASALSRLPIESTEKTDLKNYVLVTLIHDVEFVEYVCSSRVLEDIAKCKMNADILAENYMPTNLAEFIKAQREDAISKQATKQIGEGGKEFSLNKDGVIIRRASIDGALQKLIPQLLQKRIL